METELIRQRSPAQIGSTSDPLQRTARATLKVLKILQDREYPTVVTTKFPGVLAQPEYLRAIDGLPIAVQVSISSADPGILKVLEPGAEPASKRLEALRTLHEAGAHVILRLWPFAGDLAGSAQDLGHLLGMVRDSGVRTVLANPLKLYHGGGVRERLNEALGRDYLASTSLKYVNGGVFSVASHEDQLREFGRLQGLCRQHGLDLLTCDDFLRTRRWQSCCGVDGLPGFSPSPWAYYVNGRRIGDHTDFETYMSDHNCPWHAEFEQEWNAGKLARAVPELIFHEEDKTYSRRW